MGGLIVPDRGCRVRATSRRVFAILALVLMSAGCAGRDFKRPASESLAVGQATEASYAYATTALSAPGGVVPARAQEF